MDHISTKSLQMKIMNEERRYLSFCAHRGKSLNKTSSPSKRWLPATPGEKYTGCFTWEKKRGTTKMLKSSRVLFALIISLEGFSFAKVNHFIKQGANVFIVSIYMKLSIAKYPPTV